jgi:hypothetical protein
VVRSCVAETRQESEAEEGTLREVGISSSMATNLRYEDRLDGTSNYVQWKYKMKISLQESRVWNIVENPIPTPTNAKDREAYFTSKMRAQRILLVE